MAKAKRTHWPLVIGIAIAVVLFAGILTWVFWPTPSYNYGEYVFTKQNCPGTEKDCYFASLTINGQPYEIPFENHPTSVETILFEYPVLEYLRTTLKQPGATAIIAVPDNAPASVGIAGAQLGRVLGDKYGLLNMAVIARVAGSGADQVDCRFATQKQYVIMFEQAAPTGVFVRAPNCIVVRAERLDQLGPVVDAYVYRILGIIKTYRSTDTPRVLPAPPKGVGPATEDANNSNSTNRTP